jgi:hypothetical protein
VFALLAMVCYAEEIKTTSNLCIFTHKISCYMEGITPETDGNYKGVDAVIR